MKKKSKINIQTIPKYLGLSILGVIMIGPLFWIVTMSLKTKREFISNPLALPSEMNFENFLRIFSEEKMLRFFENSVFITIISVGIVLLASMLAGYALARINFPGNRLLFTMFLIGDAIPIFVVLIPLYLYIQAIGISGTYWSIFLPYSAMNMGLAVYMMRGFFRTITKDLEDAAMIEGCNTWQLIVHIMLPMVRPGMMVIGVLMFISYWNEYFLVQVLAPSQDLFTLPAGMASMFLGRFGSNYPIWGAGILISIIPTILLFTFAQDKIIQGWTYTSK
jgi:ABC-type glycerol-3-phosphate transport system permease component